MTTAIVLLILLLYAAGMFLLSRRAQCHTSSFQDAIAAPRQTGLLMLMGSAIGGQIGSGFVVGGAEYGAQFGIAGAWYGIGCGLSYFVTAALAGFVHRRRLVSLSDYFAQRYQGRVIRLLYSVTGLFSSIALLAGQLLAGRSIFLTLGLPSSVGVILTAVISLIYANIAGLWGAMAVSSVQSLIILIGMISALFITVLTLGPETLIACLPVEQFQMFSVGREFLFSMAGPIILSGAVSQISFQNVTSARTVSEAREGYFFAGLFLIPVALIPPLLGMFGNALFPGKPAEQAFSALLMNRLPTVIAAVILAAVICSVISACTNAYIAAATNAIYDIYQGFFCPQADSQLCRRLMLWGDIVVCIVGILLALEMDDIIQVMSMGYSLVAAGCLAPFMGGILWKRGSSRGALAAAVVGMSTCLISSFGLMELPYTSLSCVLLSGLTYVMGSLACPDQKGKNI